MFVVVVIIVKKNLRDVVAIGLVTESIYQTVVKQAVVKHIHADLKLTKSLTLVIHCTAFEIESLFSLFLTICSRKIMLSG